MRRPADPCPRAPSPANLARIATRIADILQSGDILFVTDDEQQAESLSAAVRAITPGQVVFVPSSDALPGDVAPASPANIGRRVAALRLLRAMHAAPAKSSIACILSGEASGRRYPMPDAFDPAPPLMRTGDAIEVSAIEARLREIGYVIDDRVDEPGEVAVRGEVVDIFPADAALPARIEIAAGRIAAIRAYDPVTQRTTGDLDTLEIGRASEPTPGATTTILAHLGSGSIGYSAKAPARRDRYLALAADIAHRSGRPVDAVDAETWSLHLANWNEVAVDWWEAPPVPRFVEGRSPLTALARFAKPHLAAGCRLILAGSRRDLRFVRPRLAGRLGGSFAEPTTWADALALPAGAMAMLAMPVPAGFLADDVLVVAAGDLLGSRALLDDAVASRPDPMMMAGDIRVGDVVVHEDHGLAVVSGLEAMPGDDGGEAIALDYAGGARRLVPVDQADRIWRYGADPDAVALDKLDGSSWTKRRAQIDAAIAESARGLARLADARATLRADMLEPDPALYERFSAGFPFNETADQARAIAAVRDDLASGKPMDRLVIGDVGYGKTEVALRAAALAALAGHQVAVAAPTTVLVRQHLETFRQRFQGFDIGVAGLSRLSTAAEKKAVKAGLADGSIGIVVGTGGIMAKDVRYARLGLVIVDEEQRFGAADKARLKGSGQVHLLTLSATPIPRTLQMALVGLQQMSIIATPPARRQPIRTSLDQFDDGRVRTALLREKARGGQSFVVVPRIEDMAAMGDRLRRIAPDLSIVEAHGRLPAAEIDAAMIGFAQGAGDVLLATNIIEAGLDVPRANTMIVWRADRFGLAQLHQLRGRVGRGNRRGQVILLTDGAQGIGERTLKRLRTLATFDRLGAGFEISAHDLDMRGAGDLLGETQAGHMKLIGADLYQTLLGYALRAARGETIERWTPELRLGHAGAIPDHWIPEPDLRLSLYVRVARADSDEAIDAVEDEMTDRFGPLPPETRTRIALARIAMIARQARIAKIDAGPAAIALTPHRDFDRGIKTPGLTAKGDRLLLDERVGAADRLDRVQALLEELVEAGDG